MNTCVRINCHFSISVHFFWEDVTGFFNWCLCCVQKGTFEKFALDGWWMKSCLGRKIIHQNRPWFRLQPRRQTRARPKNEGGPEWKSFESRHWQALAQLPPVDSPYFVLQPETNTWVLCKASGQRYIQFIERLISSVAGNPSAQFSSKRDKSHSNWMYHRIESGKRAVFSRVVMTIWCNCISHRW